MRLHRDEFVRRYLLHVLPHGFTRIRHMGFLANRYKADKLAQCRKALACEPRVVEEESVEHIMRCIFDIDIHLCQQCHEGQKRGRRIIVSQYQRSIHPDTA